MRFKRTFLTLWLLLPCFVLSSCYDYNDDQLSEAELQIVSLTNYDTKVDFSKYSTFAIADSIGYITSDAAGNLIVTPKYAGDITDEVTNIISGAYQKVDASADPDLAVTLFAFEIENVTVNWWYDYYWDWGWYSPWDWYYPYYTTTEYSVGTLLINIVDLNNKNEKTGKYPIIWTGAIRNVLSGTHQLAEVKSAINDCFNQGISFKGGK